MKYKSFKQILSEQSLRSQQHSIDIINELFLNNKYDTKSKFIKPKFPINDVDISSILLCKNAINNNIQLTHDEEYKYKPFSANEDYGLTILNKLFSSTNDINKMEIFLKKNIVVKLDLGNIEDLYNKFHSTFPL